MSVRTIAELKEEISIEAVLLACGAEIQTGSWTTELPVYCPFHHNVNTPAGSVNPTKGLYRCYSCGVGGSIIDLALLHLQTESIPEAMDWLEGTFL